MTTDSNSGVQLRVPAEERYAAELVRLAEWDRLSGGDLPPGWLRSPRAVRKFILGDDALAITRKFYGWAVSSFVDSLFVDQAATAS